MQTRNLQLGCLLGVSVLQNLLLDYDTHNNLCVVLGNISEFWCQTLIYRFFFLIMVRFCFSICVACCQPVLLVS